MFLINLANVLRVWSLDRLPITEIDRPHLIFPGREAQNKCENSTTTRL
jgi:hypothetical protein